jgi:microcystin-dependent protein
MVALTTWPTIDTKATEERWSKMVNLWFQDGVHISEDSAGFEPYGDSTGLHVKVWPGSALVWGFHTESSSSQTLAVPAANATNGRIDRVVLRITKGGASVTGQLLLVPGTASQNPAPPGLVSTSTVKDLAIARVIVGPGVNTIRAQDVLDDRVFMLPKLNDQVGVVKMVYGPTAPIGYLPMKGQTVSTIDYPVLARYWGLQGFPTMVIPDMTNMVPRGASGTVGTIGGADTLTLDPSHLPPHSHGLETGSWSGGNHGHSFTGAPHGHALNQSPHKHAIDGDYSARWTVAVESSSLWLAGASTAGRTNAVSFTDIDPETISISVVATTAGGTVGSSGPLSGSLSGSTTQVGEGQAVSIVPRHRQLLFVIKAH